ncbi:DUF4181 domain-containing protein [Paenibacillus gallinarum]|uniref:DUF4181 domain-containing protein n=1 Tax=Paenibacillus gallinarum TaxID=2762232 RepID=A0ABR8ST72_9BACL|nr:DUF4181 domain-containing protein [Paenibacillus gallinarum]MBD7966698.1 DUF4181 domain-containing protein [Paenibacillus gallinarum]
MELLLFIIGLLILLFLIDRISNKILGVEKKKLSETSGKNVDRWGGITTLILFLITQWFGITNESDTLRMSYWMTYLAFLFGFQAIMEYIFIKESRQYISTIILLIMVLLIVYNIDYYPFKD